MWGHTLVEDERASPSSLSLTHREGSLQSLSPRRLSTVSLTARRCLVRSARRLAAQSSSACLGGASTDGFRADCRGCRGGRRAPKPAIGAGRRSSVAAADKATLESASGRGGHTGRETAGGAGGAKGAGVSLTQRKELGREERKEPGAGGRFPKGGAERSSLRRSSLRRSSLRRSSLRRSSLRRSSLRRSSLRRSSLRRSSLRRSKSPLVQTRVRRRREASTLRSRRGRVACESPRDRRRRPECD